MATTHDDSQKFMDALQTAEKTRDPGALVALFADDGSVDSIASHELLVGREKIAVFWQAYVQLFRSVSTTFTTVTTTDTISVLEWKSKGELAGGESIAYRGVSLVQFAGGRVRSFRTYYDSAAFVPEFEKHLKREQERARPSKM